jgi:hypothetical protein
LEELGEAYDAIAAGREPRLPPPPAQFLDWTLWQRALLGDPAVMERHARYWRARLADVGPRPELRLPFAHRQSEASSLAAGKVSVQLPEATRGSVRAIARRLRVSPAMLYVGAVAGILHGASTQDTVGILTAAHNRPLPVFEGIAGRLANTIVLRVDCSGSPSWRMLLERVRTIMLEALEHADFPYAYVERLLAKNDLVRPPTRPWAFMSIEYEAPRLALAGLTAEELPRTPKRAWPGFAMWIRDEASSTSLDLVYERDWLGQDGAQRLVDLLLAAVTTMATEPESPVGRLAHG